MLVVVRDYTRLHAVIPGIAELTEKLGDLAGPVMGVWCDPAAEFLPDGAGAARCAAGVFRSLRFRQAFDIAGIWAVWRFDAEGTHRLTQSLIAGSLLRVSSDEARMYVPVFDCAIPASTVEREMASLLAAHPQRIGAPLHHDRGARRLTWGRAAYA